MSNLEYRVLKNKKVDKELTMRVLKNPALSRIAVEFSSTACRMSVQKTFQDTYEGRVEAAEFEKTIKNTEDLKRYFGVK